MAPAIADLLSAMPGIATLSALVAINPQDLSPADRIDYLTALERQTGWLQALMQRAIVAVAGCDSSKPGGTDPFFGVDDAEREDISTALRLAPTTAQSRIDVARTLVNHLPNTCSALATGEISPAHATVIAKETAAAIRDGLPESAIFEIEQRAIAHAEFHTPGQVANQVRTSIARIAPETFEETVARARDTRKVSCYTESDGISTIVAILPAADAQIVMNSIESFIRAATSDIDAESDSDPRNADMKRADALTAIASAYLSSSAEIVTPHRRPISVNVTIDLPTLLGLAENPGQLAGYGAIPASVARELAADGKWKRFITDPQTGNLLDYGRQSYEPPQALIDFLIARDRTCRFPGCRRSAALSDIDHAQSWESGGRTSPDNLGALCRRHHRLKTHDGWNIESRPDGSCTWTSPLGKIYLTPARPIGDSI
ncbi:HNH nuclease [Candidatus Nanopelagicaceae bacterium]